MKLKIVRPGDKLSKGRRDELRTYLYTHMLRAKNARQQQIQSDYDAWSKAYAGIPLEEVRSVPFYKASNMVVKLIRIFLDTFCARTLNIIYATKPLYVVDGLPRELKDAWEMYMNKKSLYEWRHYWLTRDLINCGNKDGSAITKTVWRTDTTNYVDSTGGETEVTTYDGPSPCVIPFEDFFLYPITADLMEQALIKFHRVRYVEEAAVQMARDGEWTLPEGTEPADIANRYCAMPNDAKRMTEQEDAGVRDTLLREMHVIECSLRYAITNDSGKLYDVTACLEETTGDLLDVYYNPYPRNLCIYHDYRPFPRKSLFFGESLCQLLGQSQEEASRIHNERRDNSTIASSVIFKRRSGALVPNPSTNWYPGKVWDLESMDDLDVMTVGRNYDDLITQEDYTFQIAEKLTGTSEVLQGASSGQVGKRGVYNTMGTIAMMQESNQRQDTNIRDVRDSLALIASCSSMQQAEFGRDDPFIDTFSDEDKEAIQAAMVYMRKPTARYIRHEVKASDAGVNKEIERQNLMQCAQLIGQYGQSATQLLTAIINPTLNPALRAMAMYTAQAQEWMMKRLLQQFDEAEAKEILPDVQRALAAGQQQSGQGPGGGQGAPQQSVPRSTQVPSADVGGANGAQELPPVPVGAPPGTMAGANGAGPPQGGMGQ